MARLRITVDWPEGRYHGVEWPPSPWRVYQALVAGSAMERRRAPELEAALRHLEALPAPVVTAPRAAELEAVRGRCRTTTGMWSSRSTRKASRRPRGRWRRSSRRFARVPQGGSRGRSRTNGRPRRRPRGISRGSARLRARCRRWGRASTSRSPGRSSSMRPRGRGASGTPRRPTGGSRSASLGRGDSMRSKRGTAGSEAALVQAPSRPASRPRPDVRGIAPSSSSPGCGGRRSRSGPRTTGRSSSTGRARSRWRRWCVMRSITPRSAWVWTRSSSASSWGTGAMGGSRSSPCRTSGPACGRADPPGAARRAGVGGRGRVAERGVAARGCGARRGGERRGGRHAGAHRGAGSDARPVPGGGSVLDERDPGGAAGVRQPAGPAAPGALGAKAPSPRGGCGGAPRAGGVHARVAASRERSPAVVPSPGAPRALSVPAPQRRVDGPGPGAARARRGRRVRARSPRSG